ncbi:agmatinase, partial [Candidatus Woesearchaeota archaeon]|nr:agmatinase [Candidatus Woesearchaeota archaeon]
MHYGGPDIEHCTFDKAKIVIVPVPYDGTSSYGKGSDKGPEALIHASSQMELYDIETDSEAYLEGIHTDKDVTEKSTPEKMVEAVKKRVSGHLQHGKYAIVLGGEHSVSNGTIQAHAEKFDDLSVLQI